MLSKIIDWSARNRFLVLLATLFIREVPLRDTVHTPDEAGRELLDTMSQGADDHLAVPLGREGGTTRTSERPEAAVSVG